MSLCPGIPIPIEVWVLSSHLEKVTSHPVVNLVPRVLSRVRQRTLGTRLKIKLNSLNSRLVGDESKGGFSTDSIFFYILNWHIDSMFTGKIFSKERSLLLIWQKLPDNYASCNGENFIVSKRVAFRLLALAVPDSVKTEITIAFPDRNIMECTLVVILFSVNAGKVINTRREVVEAVLLMLFKTLISCVHPEASWS